MPNTKVVRSFNQSGLKKAVVESASTANGGIEIHGVHEDVNSTYIPIHSFAPDPNPKNLVNEVPLNLTYAEKIPSTPEPLGSVDLAPVERGGQNK